MKKLLATIALSLCVSPALAEDPSYYWDGQGKPQEPIQRNYEDHRLYYIDLNTYLMDLSIWQEIKDKETGFPRELSKSEKECLALNVYHEARGESVEGQEAVVYIALNRSLSKSRKYGKSNHLCDIIKANSAFSWMNDGFKGAKNIAAWTKAVELVDRVVASYHIDNSPIADATHYVNKETATTSHKWWESPKMIEVDAVGAHTFYRYRNEVVAINGKYM